MEQVGPLPQTRALPVRGGGLSLVRAPLRLASPDQPAPPAWEAAIAQLLGWLGVAADLRPAERGEGARLFAPWIGWNPAAFQLGGDPRLPSARFAASYCLEHARAAGPGRGGVDMMLVSPHPHACSPLPQTGVLDAMLNAARAEGRERIALVGHACQRAALAAMLEGETVDILAIEDALAPLASGRAPWDAIIAMPEWRSTVFTLLAQASGVRRAWPMLWFGQGGLVAITCEAAGEGAADASPLALDAPALIQALALALHHAGAVRAGWRLHQAWARLRDSGVTTPGRSAGDAPYATEVTDSTFIAMVCRATGASKRQQAEWLALKNDKSAKLGSQIPLLRVVS